MSRRRRKTFENVEYTPLATKESDFVDAQFTRPPPKLPWKAICFAVFLFLGGLMLLASSLLVIIGYVDVKYADRMWPMVISGILMFIPGAYHVRMAYYAYKRVPGYSFDDIPEFE